MNVETLTYNDSRLFETVQHEHEAKLISLSQTLDAKTSDRSSYLECGIEKQSRHSQKISSVSGASLVQVNKKDNSFTDKHDSGKCTMPSANEAVEDNCATKKQSSIVHKPKSSIFPAHRSERHFFHFAADIIAEVENDIGKRIVPDTTMESVNIPKRKTFPARRSERHFFHFAADLEFLVADGVENDPDECNISNTDASCKRLRTIE